MRRDSKLSFAGRRPAPARSALAIALTGCLLLAGIPGAHAQSVPTRTVALKKLSLEELINIEVVSVSRRPEKLSESASAIQVVTNDDIRRSGATSVPEALRGAMNLAVAQIDSRQWAINARGFNTTTSNKLLVLIDGRTAYTLLFSGVFWDVQDTLLEDLDQIEVISGPGATQWGANAVNGVINITTKEAKDTQGLLVSGGGGNELRNFGGVRYGGKAAPNVHYRVYGKHSDRDHSALPNGQPATDAWDFDQGGFRVDWTPASTGLVTVQGDIYEGKIAQPGTKDIAVSGNNLLGRWSHPFAADSAMKLQLYYDQTHRLIPGSFVEDIKTYDLDFQHRFKLGSANDLVWGAGYRVVDDDIGNSATLAFLPAQVSHNFYNVFLQDEIALVPDQLHFTLGTKVEHNDYTGFEYQPSARLSWKLRPTQLIWGAISRAVRAPSRLDRDLYAPGNPPFSVLVGGPNFESETLIAYELGWRSHPLPQVMVSISAFYNDYDKLRSIEPLTPPASRPIFIGNGLKGSSSGGEVAVDYRATDRLRLRAGYTQTHIHIQPKPGSGDTSFGSGESHDPNHQVFLRASLDLPGQVEFDASYRYVAHIVNQSVPAYDEVDLHLGWHPTDNWEISLVGQNLLNPQHAEFNPPATRREIERGVYGKLTWRY